MIMFVYILLGLIALSNCKAIDTNDAIELAGEQGKKTSMNFLIVEVGTII